MFIVQAPNMPDPRERCLWPKAHVDSVPQLIVICGPPIFERTMGNMLGKLGYPPESYYFFSQDN
jgi:hypothetical protein